MKILLFLLLLGFHAQVGLAKKKPKPVLKIPSKTVYSVRLNDTVRLPCIVKKQYKGIRKKILFFWSKRTITGFQLIRLNLARHNVVFNEYLEISNVQSTDHGNYTCHAKNQFGTANMMVRLIVENRDLNATVKPITIPKDGSNSSGSDIYRQLMGAEPLRVTIPFLQKHYVSGSQAKLKCLVKGESDLVVKWLFKGKLLMPSMKYIEKTKILKIQNFSSEDSGNYTCLAFSSNKKVNMTVHASVLRSFKPTKKSVSLTVKPGQNITLTCELPADEVKYTMWDIPEKLQNQKNQASGNDVQRDLAFKDIALHPKNELNRIFVDTYQLYHLNESIHSGKYVCKAAFVNGDRIYVVKEYHIQFSTDVSGYGATSNTGNKLWMIFVPIVAVLLTLIVVLLICIRCRKKHAKLLSQHSSIVLAGDDDEDTASLQILTKEPHGSLTIHRKSDEPTQQHTGSFNNSGTLERRYKIDKVSTVSLGSVNKNTTQHHSAHEATATGCVSKSDSMLSKPANTNYSNDRTLSENALYSSSSVKKKVDKGNNESCTSCSELRRSSPKRSPKHSRKYSLHEPLLSNHCISVQSRTNSPKHAHSKQSHNNISHDHWPGERLQPGDPEYIDFQDEDCSVRNVDKIPHREERLLSTCHVDKRRSSLCGNLYHDGDEESQKNENTKDTSTERTRRRSKTPPLISRNSIHSDDRNSRSSSTPPSVTSLHSASGSLPCLYLPEHPEEEDLLLKREMKMWEPLLKNSSYDKNANVEKIDVSTKLLAPLTPSDELSHRKDLIL